MTSVTKFIGGHSDITGGILAVRGKALADKMYFHQNAEGAIMAPFECWLALRCETRDEIGWHGDIVTYRHDGGDVIGGPDRNALGRCDKRTVALSLPLSA